MNFDEIKKIRHPVLRIYSYLMDWSRKFSKILKCLSKSVYGAKEILFFFCKNFELRTFMLINLNKFTLLFKEIFKKEKAEKQNIIEISEIPHQLL